MKEIKTAYRIVKSAPHLIFEAVEAALAHFQCQGVNLF